eukprot:2705696-Rhodomonas_salina.3
MPPTPHLIVNLRPHAYYHTTHHHSLRSYVLPHTGTSWSPPASELVPRTSSRATTHTVTSPSELPRPKTLRVILCLSDGAQDLGVPWRGGCRALAASHARSVSPGQN